MKQYLSLGVVGLVLLFTNGGNVFGDITKSGSAAVEQMNKQSAQQEQRKKSMEAVQKEKMRAEKLREPIIQAAQEGMGEVIVAVDLLEQGREKDALEHLQKADGKLDTAVAGNPGLAFATVASTMEMYSNLDSNEEIEKELAYIENLFDEDRVQEARRQLSRLRDEIVVTTTSLPLGTYPLAIKDAVKNLAEGKADEAHATLVTAMNSLVVSEVVLPIPVLLAKDAVERASNMNKDNKHEVLETLDFAHRQIEKAETLGYVTDDSKNYEQVEEQIEALKEEVEGKNQVENIYGTLKKEMNNLWNNITG
jgi:hypothetical protein